MSNLLIIKRALALLLLVCFFLPLSQCTRKIQPELNTQSVAVEKADILTPYKTIKFKSIDEFGLVLLFFWPFLALIIRSYLVKKQYRITLSVVEVAVSLFCIYYMWLIFGLWPTILVGGYLAITAFIGYAAVSVITLCCEFLNKRV
jgi:hypothetical protein